MFRKLRFWFWGMQRTGKKLSLSIGDVPTYEINNGVVVRAQKASVGAGKYAKQAFFAAVEKQIVPISNRKWNRLNVEDSNKIQEYTSKALEDIGWQPPAPKLEQQDQAIIDKQYNEIKKKVEQLRDA